MSMSMNVSVHHPEVQKGELGVHRINSGEPNQLVVTFNSSDRYGGVTLFVSDAEWNAIVDQVAAFRATEERITEFDVDLDEPLRWHACQECGHAYTLAEAEAEFPYHNTGLCLQCWDDRRD